MFRTVTDRKIRVAVVGCGRISKNHFSSIEAHSDKMELAAVCEIEHEARFGVAGYRHLKDMLEHKSIDLAAICTPSGLHPEQVIQCAKSGVHVVTEKPMATRWQDGLRMVRACDEARVRLFVVKQNRRNTTLQLLKRALEEGRFGRIYMVQLNVFWTRPQEYYDSAKWRGTWELDGWL